MINPNQIIISLGSNIGDKEKNLAQAKTLLKNFFSILSETTIVETEPHDYLEQPTFSNQLILVYNSQYSAQQVLTILKRIEQEMGRTKTIEKGPRNIDLDLLFFGNCYRKCSTLLLPHQNNLERKYNIPLLESLLNKKMESTHA